MFSEVVGGHRFIIGGQIKKFRVGSLFAGIGGFDLGLQWAGMEIVWQVEINEYCRRVLAKHWPTVRRYEDIKQCGAHNLEPVDLICGGFPCQPFSTAGKRRGIEDDRHLWPEMLRVIQECRPNWIICENVIGFDGMGLDSIISDLETAGYEVAPPFEISAASVGLQTMEWHVWITAKADVQRCVRSEENKDSHVGKKGEFQGDDTGMHIGRNISETRFCRVAERVSGRMDRHQRDRLKALGNAVPPQVVEVIGRAILEINSKEK